MLDQIVARKQIELLEDKVRKPFEVLLAELSGAQSPDFQRALQGDGINIIAEVKYSSPSHGPFAIQWPPQEVVQAYLDGGAAAVSVLTDQQFFNGKPEYLQQLRGEFPELALLRKDFLIDRYQVLEARVWGASAYLLIVACLEAGQLSDLMGYGAELGLDALVEVHDLRELETAVESGARLIGVNNRNLKTFDVDLDTSFRVARRLEGESGFTLVSESGIREYLQIQELQDAGFSAYLIGSSMMDSQEPAAKLRELRGEARESSRNDEEMLIKICGVTTAEDAQQAIAAGANALGFNFYSKSPRCITARQADAILDRLPDSALRVAVVVIGQGDPLPEIPERIDVVQVHGAAEPEDLPQMGKRLWVAVTPEQAERFPDHEIVIDPSWGSGQKADWDELQSLGCRPYILSGGLTPENVSEALHKLDPTGVDVCSGVESVPGRKDRQKVTRFIQAVQAARKAVTTPT